MVGADGWCIHFDTGGRRCRIYDQRPDFCRVENLMSLFGSPNQEKPVPLSPSQANQLSQLDQRRAAKAPKQAKDLEEIAQLQAAIELQAANELAISCCKQQIRSEYGGRGRVMRRFLRAIRQQP
jgi:Fe-S-cluster containining protein